MRHSISLRRKIEGRGRGKGRGRGISERDSGGRTGEEYWLSLKQGCKLPSPCHHVISGLTTNGPVAVRHAGKCPFAGSSAAHLMRREITTGRRDPWVKQYRLHLLLRM